MLLLLLYLPDLRTKQITTNLIYVIRVQNMLQIKIWEKLNYIVVCKKPVQAIPA